MGTTAEKLQYLSGTKDAIKSSIVGSGVDVPDGTTFRAYADKVGNIVGQFSDELDDIMSGGLTPSEPGKIITPSTTEQLAIAGGVLAGGDIKVAGDANLAPENIAEGVSIFGVQGSFAGGASPIIIPFDGSRAISTRAGGGINEYHTVTFSYGPQAYFALVYPYTSLKQMPHVGSIITFSPSNVYPTAYGSSSFVPSITSNSNNQMQLNVGVDLFGGYLGVYIYVFDS